MSKFLKKSTLTVGGIAAMLVVAFVQETAADQSAPYNLGREALPEEVAAWDIDVRPDGKGLPVGSGDVFTGEEVWIEKCASCHGDFAEGSGRWPVLAGGIGTLASENPVKTIGSYWPYLSTVYDYVNRAMPFGNAQSLTDDEVYALTAYLLYSNDIVDDEFTLSNDNFLEVEMPNTDNFYPDDRVEVEMPLFSVEACMSDCKTDVAITMRAAVVDVTPETDGDAEVEEAAADVEATEEPAAVAEVAVVEVAALDMELVAAGEGAFRQCKSCHQVGDKARNRTGPMLNNIVGNPAGSVEGFRYSGPMEEAAAGGLVWTEEELGAFLTDPRGYMQGTKMTFRGVRKPEDIAGLIEYLKSFEAD
ncbi:MAG: c-type cytochrome [Yoonia sp.]|nr:c-type cytochrome [Yoonia sp.]